jgi:N-acetylmuramoyl-L-alanine amidase/putative cell wall-binding protein
VRPTKAKKLLNRRVFLTLSLALVMAAALPVVARGATSPLPDGAALTGAAPRAPFTTVYPDKTRLVFDLPSTPTSVIAALATDGSLTIDYAGIALSAPVTLPVGSEEIDSVQAAQVSSSPPTVRITLALARYQRFRVMWLAPSGEEPQRIVVDVYKRTAGPSGDGPPLICLDPGHGRPDSGAISVSGVLEKDMNLALGLALADNLRSSGLRVLMTRPTDPIVDLHLRAQMANEAGANLFVSLHHNSYGTPDAHGTQTFYKGTPDSYPAEGKLLAEAIQRNLVATLGLTDRGARTHWSALVVLNETLMTQVLVEVGFLSNPGDEAKLLSASGKRAATWGIVNGIREYLMWSTRVFTTEAAAPGDYVNRVTYTSLRGSDRFDTAIRISQAMYPAALPDGGGLVLAPGETFPEALCGAPLAAAYGGPVLLTQSLGLNKAVAEEMLRLAPDRVFCVGLSASVVAQVTAALGSGTNVTAIRGTGGSVYEMSRRVAEALSVKLGDMSGATAIIARGDSFPDALGVSPLACANKWPILLTKGPAGSLNASAAAALSTLHITRVLKVGTYAVLPAGVSGIANLSGKDRYATNRNVAEWGKSSGLMFTHIGLATGDKFPDALAAGPYLALDRGILLLSPLSGPLPTCIGTEIAANSTAVFRVSFIAMLEPVVSQVRARLP